MRRLQAKPRCAHGDVEGSKRQHSVIVLKTDARKATITCFAKHTYQQKDALGRARREDGTGGLKLEQLNRFLEQEMDLA